MKTKFLLFAPLMAFLVGCEAASDAVAVDPVPSSNILQSPAATEMGAALPRTFTVKLHSTGTAQLIGWCDEAGGVVRATAPGTGSGAHFGRYQIEQTSCVNTVTGALNDGAATLTTANGDRIYFTYEGQALPGFALPAYDLLYVGVGGTGRFASAEVEVDVRVTYTSASTWTATGTGWLRYAPSNRSQR